MSKNEHSIRAIVGEWLREHKAEGLLCDDSDCTCSLDDLMRCDQPCPEHCVPARRAPRERLEWEKVSAKTEDGRRRGHYEWRKKTDFDRAGVWLVEPVWDELDEAQEERLTPSGRYACHFGWGRPGPHATELASAILADCYNARLADRLATRFADEIIYAEQSAKIPFQLAVSKVRAWVEGALPRPSANPEP